SPRTCSARRARSCTAWRRAQRASFSLRGRWRNALTLRPLLQAKASVPARPEAALPLWDRVPATPVARAQPPRLLPAPATPATRSARGASRMGALARATRLTLALPSAWLIWRLSFALVLLLAMLLSRLVLRSLLL